MSVTKRMTLVSVGFTLQWHEMKALISANNVTSPWVSTSVFHTFIDFHSRWTAEERVCVCVCVFHAEAKRLRKALHHSWLSYDWLSVQCYAQNPILWTWADVTLISLNTHTHLRLMCRLPSQQDCEEDLLKKLHCSDFWGTDCYSFSKTVMAALIQLQEKKKISLKMFLLFLKCWHLLPRFFSLLISFRVSGDLSVVSNCAQICQKVCKQKSNISIWN